MQQNDDKHKHTNMKNICNVKREKIFSCSAARATNGQTKHTTRHSIAHKNTQQDTHGIPESFGRPWGEYTMHCLLDGLIDQSDPSWNTSVRCVPPPQPSCDSSHDYQRRGDCIEWKILEGNIKSKQSKTDKPRHQMRGTSKTTNSDVCRNIY